MTLARETQRGCTRAPRATPAVVEASRCAPLHKMDPMAAICYGNEAAPMLPQPSTSKYTCKGSPLSWQKYGSWTHAQRAPPRDTRPQRGRPRAHATPPPRKRLWLSRFRRRFTQFTVATGADLERIGRLSRGRTHISTATTSCTATLYNRQTFQKTCCPCTRLVRPLVRRLYEACTSSEWPPAHFEP